MSEAAGRPVPGAAVVCLWGERVLLVQRAREPNLGRWSYPGGKIEPGETARQAAAREAFEETGLHVRVLDVVDVYDAIFPPYHYCVADYLAVPTDETAPRPGDDVLDARWVPFCHLHEYDLTEAMQRVLDRARWLITGGSGAHWAAPPSLGMEIEAVAPAGIASGLGPMEMLLRAGLRERVRGLYVITDDRPGWTHLEIARAALEGGARIVQLRDKRRDAGELLPLAREIRELCAPAGALFLVNDRVDLALACGADGVHLGQTDLPVADARRQLGPAKLIGISVENAEQVREAEAAGADYLGVGAIYGSATKQDAGAAVGPGQLSLFREATVLPLVAIGGITLERISEVREAGADAVAVISAVAAADDPLAAVRELVSGLEG